MAEKDQLIVIDVMMIMGNLIQIEVVIKENLVGVEAAVHHQVIKTTENQIRKKRLNLDLSVDKSYIKKYNSNKRKTKCVLKH